VSTTHTLTFQYDRPAERVLALLLDPEFVAARSRAMGELDVNVTVRKDGDRVTLVNQRNVKRDLPSFAAKLFSPVNQVTQTETWQTGPGAAGAKGSYQLDVKGAPVAIKATFELRPTAAGSEWRITFDISARVPLIGGKLESFVLEQTKVGALKELEYTAAQARQA
jgi:hypothetical protein